VSKPLLQRVAEGDNDAVRACIANYSGLIWSLARKFCATQSEAEDVVQDIFVSLWKSADRFDPRIASEATFVAMIARRRLIDHTRRMGRQQAEVSSIDQFAVPATPPPADASEEAAFAYQAFQTLNPDQQKVLRMAIFHGLSHEKIAESTQMPLGTVKTHIRRGLIKIRERLDHRSSTQQSLRESVS
jgi:RNA polymerase sigma-70 factor (ECF subfamily)